MRPGLARLGRNAARAAYALLAGLALIASTVRGQETAAQTDIIPYRSETRVLDNGLKVIVMPMPTDGLVAYWSIVRTGSRDEYEPGHTGFAHFFEHMMFRGTERFPAAVYQGTLTEIGADTNAYTTDDYTAYYVQMTAEDLERVVELESDRFQNLAYAEPAFQTEAGAVYGEYRKNRTNPLFTLYEALAAVAFEQHSYGHTTLGYERDIAAMPKMYDYSRSFFARYYRPENTVLFIAGDVSAERVLPLVERYYGQWKRGYVPPEVPTEPEQRGERRIAVAYDGQTLPTLELAYKLPAFDPADRTRVAADLLAALAFGETSQIYRQLVLDEKVVELLDVETSPHRDPGLFDITVTVKEPDQVDHVLAVIDATIAAYREMPPDAARLADLQRRVRYGFLMNLETPAEVAARLARLIAVTGDLDAVRALYASYAAVTPADVQTAAQRYLSAERRTVGVLRSRQ